VRAIDLKRLREQAVEDFERQEEEACLKKQRELEVRLSNGRKLLDFFADACQSRCKGLWEVGLALRQDEMSALTDLGYVLRYADGRYYGDVPGPLAAGDGFWLAQKYFDDKAEHVARYVDVVADAMRREGYRSHADRILSALDFERTRSFLRDGSSPGAAYLWMVHVLRTASDNGNYYKLSKAEMREFLPLISQALSMASLESMPLFVAKRVSDKTLLPKALRDLVEELNEANFQTPDTAQYDFFANSERFSGDRRDVASALADDGSPVFVYLGPGWQQHATSKCGEDAKVQTGFGWSVEVPTALSEWAMLEDPQWQCLYNSSFVELTSPASPLIEVLKAMMLAAEAQWEGCILINRMAGGNSLCSVSTLDGDQLFSTSISGSRRPVEFPMNLHLNSLAEILGWLGYEVELKTSSAQRLENCVVKWG